MRKVDAAAEVAAIAVLCDIRITEPCLHINHTPYNDTIELKNPPGTTLSIFETDLTIASHPETPQLQSQRKC